MQLRRLGQADFERILSAACAVGLVEYSLTGGDPLGTPHDASLTFALAGLLHRTLNGQWHEVKLNTNGATLLDYLDEVVAAEFKSVKVSLDTLKPATFAWLTRRNGRVLHRTVEGLLALRERAPALSIRPQMVVGTYNVDELEAMLGFCRAHGLDLKIFDISKYDNALGGPTFGVEHYVALGPITEWIGRYLNCAPAPIRPTGGGHKMTAFDVRTGDGLWHIRVRDTVPGATYSNELCGTCPLFPCQDGLCTLVVAADGHVRFCREGGQEQTIPTRDQAGTLLGASLLARGPGCG